MKSITPLACAALAGCQSFTLNGVDLAENKLVWGLALASIAAAVYHLEQDQDAEPERECLRFVSPPIGKDQSAGNICAVYVD